MDALKNEDIMAVYCCFIEDSALKACLLTSKTDSIIAILFALTPLLGKCSRAHVLTQKLLVQMPDYEQLGLIPVISPLSFTWLLKTLTALPLPDFGLIRNNIGFSRLVVGSKSVSSCCGVFSGHIAGVASVLLEVLVLKVLLVEVLEMLLVLNKEEIV